MWSPCRIFIGAVTATFRSASGFFTNRKSGHRSPRQSPLFPWPARRYPFDTPPPSQPQEDVKISSVSTCSGCSRADRVFDGSLPSPDDPKLLRSTPLTRFLNPAGSRAADRPTEWRISSRLSRMGRSGGAPVRVRTCSGFDVRTGARTANPGAQNGHRRPRRARTATAPMRANGQYLYYYSKTTVFYGRSPFAMRLRCHLRFHLLASATTSATTIFIAGCADLVGLGYSVRFTLVGEYGPRAERGYFGSFNWSGEAGSRLWPRNMRGRRSEMR